MACVDFDPEDYIDDIRTESLLKELMRRNAPFERSTTLPTIREELIEAWQRRDEIGFYRALALIEDPDEAEQRAANIRAAYAKLMNRKVA